MGSLYGAIGLTACVSKQGLSPWDILLLHKIASLFYNFYPLQFAVKPTFNAIFAVTSQSCSYTYVCENYRRH